MKIFDKIKSKKLKILDSWESKIKNNCLRYCKNSGSPKCPTSIKCFALDDRPYFVINETKLKFKDKLIYYVYETEHNKVQCSHCLKPLPMNDILYDLGICLSCSDIDYPVIILEGQLIIECPHCHEECKFDTDIEYYVES